MGEGRNNELGEMLRHWRDRMDPASAGLPNGRARRAAGLRREELALLSGVSVDYIIRLEQGRGGSPSGQVLQGLAGALRLSEPERRYLFLLAGKPMPMGDRMSASLTPGVRRLLDQLEGTPVGVYDASWTLSTWNRMFAVLLGDPSGRSGRERNVLWRHFTGLVDRVGHTPEQEARFEAAAVADLRAAAARYPSDAGLQALIAELRGASSRFAGLWDSRTMGVHTMNTKTIHHPEAGTLVLDCDVLTVPDSDLRLVVHTAAPGSVAAERLGLLAESAALCTRPSVRGWSGRPCR